MVSSVLSLMGDTDILTDRQIENIISNYARWKSDYVAKIDFLRREYQQLDENIYSYMTRTTSFVRETPGFGAPRKDEMLHLVAQKGKVMEAYEKELVAAIQNKEMELLHLERVYLCYMALPPNEHRILKLLYEEKCPWKTLPSQMGISKSAALCLRKEALNRIRTACSSYPEMC